ncbi:RNA-directed DNA polymerase, eukaryota [Tanacetum coccineum]
MKGNFNRFDIQSFWNNTQFKFAYKNSNGKSGGILAVWDTTWFSLTHTTEGDGFLALYGNWRDVDSSCLIVIVYALQDYRDKINLWNNLTKLIDRHNNFSILFGDFNELSWAFSVSGSPPVTIKTKLQRLKASIKEWRSGVQKSEEAAFCEVRNKIDRLDNKAELAPLCPAEIESRINSVKLLANLEHQKVKDLKQKAKVRWASEGDENSHFFHGIINGRRNRSRINGLNIHGEWITEPSVIKNHIFNYFSTRFREENYPRPLFSSNLFKHLSIGAGPDRFTFKFFKRHWDILEQDVVTCVKDFKASAFIPRGCNSSFITLVPKVDDPLVVGDFRPISLIGCQYKIIAKLLVNRLARVVSSVVGDVQMAYIMGRQIIDGPLVVDEIIDWAKKH